jgi:hypothetical protein
MVMCILLLGSAARHIRVWRLGDAILFGVRVVTRSIRHHSPFRPWTGTCKASKYYRGYISDEAAIIVKMHIFLCTQLVSPAELLFPACRRMISSGKDLYGLPCVTGDRPQTGPWGGVVLKLQPRPRSGLKAITHGPPTVWAIRPGFQTGGLEPSVPRDARYYGLIIPGIELWQKLGT